MPQFACLILLWRDDQLGCVARGQQATNYGQYEPRGYDGPPLQQQAPYGQGYGPQPHAVPPYQYAPGPVNVFVNNPPVSNTDNGPLIVEVLLSVFLGIYGVGWLMAGESTVGVILLICSFVVYLPGGGKLPIPSPPLSTPAPTVGNNLHAWHRLVLPGSPGYRCSRAQRRSLKQCVEAQSGTGHYGAGKSDASTISTIPTVILRSPTINRGATDDILRAQDDRE
jgi:hypothetical protein